MRTYYMAKKPLRFSAYWNQIGTGNASQTSRGYQDTVIDAPSTVANYEYLLAALRSTAPGQWSQNVLLLSSKLTSAAYLCINTLANQAADAERKVMERTEDPHESDVELPYTDPLCRLLENPNNDDGWPDLAYQVSLQLSMTGISLVWKPTLYADEVPRELYSIPSASALPWPPSPIYPHGSYLIQPYYPYGPFSTIPSYQSAAGARIPGEQIIRIKNHHPILHYDGYAVMTAMSRQIDTIDSIDMARLSTQQKGIDPTISMSLPPELYNPNSLDFKRLRAQLEALYAGPDKAGKILFVPMGGKTDKLSNTPAEMGWQEGWEQLVRFVSAAFGTPAPITGMMNADSYATLHSSLKQFHLISLNPHLGRIAIKFNKHLIHPYFGDDLYLSLNGRKITDEDERIKKYTTALPYKVLRRNEVRQFLEMSPIEGPDGDEFVAREATAAGKGVPGMPGLSQDPGADQDPEVEQYRPDAHANDGSLGPQPDRRRKHYRNQRAASDRLAGLLDNMKVKGIAHDAPPNGHKTFNSGLNGDRS